MTPPALTQNAWIAGKGGGDERSLLRVVLAIQ
jgi:hypothetical protein